MRLSAFLPLVVTGFVFTVVPAAADIAISSAPTQNMACSAGVCSPTAVNAVLNVQDLANLLASGNATVTTTGSGVQANDIRLDAPLAWTAATGLTLDAFRSIKLNRAMTVADLGTVSLRTNDGGSGGEFWCGDKGRLEFMSTSSGLTIDGTAYMLVNSVASLASAIAANPRGAFALANSYDASRDGTYAASPITTAFGGSFNGLGNTISNLSVNDPTQNAYVGFFAQTAAGSAIGNLRLVTEYVQGASGSAGQSSTEFVGGLVGYANGTISHSSTTGSVMAGDYGLAGGVAGVSTGKVAASESSASVSSGAMGVSGGLVGLLNYGAIDVSRATGSVSADIFAGGLVGVNYFASIRKSSATGSVTGTNGYVGGLAGLNSSGVIDSAQAYGTVTGKSVCGGLVGMNSNNGGREPAKISRSFATGNVIGSLTATPLGGGLVGYNNFGDIRDSYASGAVTAENAGGLVGQNFKGLDAISASYATGAVNGESGGTGGLIGYDSHETATVRHGYWDMTTSGITDPSRGAGNIANDPGIKGLTDKKLKSGLPKGFNPKIWNENSNINGGLPYLIANPPQR